MKRQLLSISMNRMSSTNSFLAEGQHSISRRPARQSKAGIDGLILTKPFLKWAGGKAALLPELVKRLPGKYGKYCEPFLGGAALFFYLQPQSAILIDENEELINTYLAVKRQPARLMKLLSAHPYDRRHFYEVRELDRQRGFARKAQVVRAARFIYLNKTCFNGLYRVNKAGKFNVPFGRYKNPRLFDRENLFACSKALSKAKILAGNYQSCMKDLHRNDFVYLDPPYAPVSKTSNFASYTGQGFGWEEQKRLFDFCCELDRKKIFFLLSNSYTPQLIEMYSRFNLEILNAPRAINSVAAKRGPVKEILVRNYNGTLEA